MRLRDVQEHTHSAQWVVDWSKTGQCDYSNPMSVWRTHRPVLQLSLLDVLRSQLNEATYRDIMSRIDPEFLEQGKRSQEEYDLHRSGTMVRYYLRGISYQGFVGDTMSFYVTPSTEYTIRDPIHTPRPKPPYYKNLIRFMSWEDVGGDPNLTPKEKASLILWSSDLQLDCNDPSFIFWGYKYILSQLDASIGIENRPPHKRNPGGQGIVCKHLNRILHVLPFYVSDIGKAIIAQWGGQIDRRAMDAIRRRADAQRQANQENPDLPPESDLQTVDQPEPMEQQPLEDPLEQPEFPEDDDETPRPV